MNRVEKILRYGEGNFLRGFVDRMVDILNEKTDFNGSVAIVQPMDKGLCDPRNTRKGVYTVLLRGVHEEETVEKQRKITSVSRCPNPHEDEHFVAYRQPGCSDDLRFVVSNTGFRGRDLTEVEGLQLHVEEYLNAIYRNGMKATLRELA
ncbi:MAG: hypothetical protein GX911_00275 [Spirochaetales bacterium]|nr:hypothetical protein [Spirochaetales bacterium]